MEGTGGARQAINLDHERRLRDLELWRVSVDAQVAEHGAELSRWVPVVDELAVARRIAEAVAGEMVRRGGRALSRWQRVGVVLGAATAVGSVLYTWLHSFGVIG